MRLQKLPACTVHQCLLPHCVWSSTVIGTCRAWHAYRDSDLLSKPLNPRLDSAKRAKPYRLAGPLLHYVYCLHVVGSLLRRTLVRLSTGDIPSVPWSGMHKVAQRRRGALSACLAATWEVAPSLHQGISHCACGKASNMQQALTKLQSCSCLGLDQYGDCKHWDGMVGSRFQAARQ